MTGEQLYRVLVTDDQAHLQVFCDDLGMWNAVLRAGSHGADIDEVELDEIEGLLNRRQLCRVEPGDTDYGGDGFGFVLVPVARSAVDRLADLLPPSGQSAGWFRRVLSDEWKERRGTTTGSTEDS